MLCILDLGVASEYRRLGNLRRCPIAVIAIPTILCIDDDMNFLELEKRILEANGCKVLLALNGPTGITSTSNSAIDVAVVAFEMRGMEGGYVAEVLLKNQQDLPIVICTDFFDAVPEGLRWFAAACVEKRDGVEVLLSAIQGDRTQEATKSSCC